MYPPNTLPFFDLILINVFGLLLQLGLLTFAFYSFTVCDFPVFGKSMYFLLNNVSEALKINIIH
jgi:hypothetical protein